MSYTFTLSDKRSKLSSAIYPAIQLDPNSEYVIGLVNFETYNSIPNIDERNNKFYLGNYDVNIPDGSYQLEDINKYLGKKFKVKDGKVKISLIANNNTLQCEMRTSEPVNFTHPNTIRELLGFQSKIYQPDKLHISEDPVNIIKVNAICIDCNIVTNSYHNSKQVHRIHEFFPSAASGYKIIENPLNVIYLPINTNTIDNIEIKIVDQDGDLINFRKETVTVRLHLKKL